MVFDKYKVRSMNENLVLKNLIRYQPISRAALARHTKLNKATITEIISTLIDRQLVSEIGYGNSKEVGGRKPILLELNKNAGIAISFDLGNDYIDAVATNLNGEIIDTFIIKNISVSSDNIVDLVQQGVQRFIPYAKKTPYEIIGMTLAVHGVVYDGHVTLSPNYNMMGAHLSEKLKTMFDFPIFLENEANLAATGHITYSNNLQNIVVLSIHTGIGAGIVINSQLYTGAQGAAGEIGHMTIVPNGLKCRCGRKGCYEQYCSTANILKSFSLLSGKSSPTLSDLAEHYPNNKELQTLIDDSMFYLATGLNNIIASYNPQMIYIVSELAAILPNTIDIIQHHLQMEFHRDVQIQLSYPGFGATLRGGASMCISEFLNIEELKLNNSETKQLL